VDIYKPDRAKASLPDRPEYFSGQVHTEYLRRPEQTGAAELIAVFFDPGARTIPHIHAVDQVLVCVEGQGLVVTSADRRALRAGEIAVIPGGTWHWHGATKTTAMCHISIKGVGPTDWSVPRQNWDKY
jgi:quercetin dioxygenase-like cupin family protein